MICGCYADALLARSSCGGFISEDAKQMTAPAKGSAASPYGPGGHSEGANNPNVWDIWISLCSDGKLSSREIQERKRGASWFIQSKAIELSNVYTTVAGYQSYLELPGASACETGVYQ